MRQLKKELWPCSVRVNLPPEDITPIELWLALQFGALKDRWNVIYRFNHTEYYFRNQKDANWFALRWA
jgi:hypothetical protein